MSDDARLQPPASSEEVRLRFKRQRTRDTAPELALRRALHRNGLRYRVDMPPLRGVRRRADVVFTSARVAVFVDGCFWHRCPLHSQAPKSNAEWWADKLERTVTRDRETDARLAAAGWIVVRVWEHDDPEEAAERIVTTLAQTRPGNRPAR